MVRMKICGITRAQDAEVAVRAGADYLGFIFAPSPRRLELARAAEIIRGLPAGTEPVGVFVDETLKRILEVVRVTGLRLVQLHGREPPELCREIEDAAGVGVIKVFRLAPGDITGLEEIGRYPTDLVLVEPYLEGSPGGTGRTVDWNLAHLAVNRFPDRRVFLAGGLGPENVARAVRRVRPFAVDASSALELTPGIKDPDRVWRFAEVIRSL